MNPDVLEKIRKSIPTVEMSDNRISSLLYTSPVALQLSEDILGRERIIAALGYDPEDKWK